MSKNAQLLIALNAALKLLHAHNDGPWLEARNLVSGAIRLLESEVRQPDCDICDECGEHANFEEDEDGDYLSNCCDAGAYNTDPDIDMER